MTRTAVCVLLLTALTVTGVVSGIWIDRRCGDMLEGIEKVTQLAEDGDTDEAVRAAQELDSEWEKFRRSAALLVMSSKLYEPDRGFAVLEYLAEDAGEVRVRAAELEHEIELLRDSEIPLFRTIL